MADRINTLVQPMQKSPPYPPGNATSAHTRAQKLPTRDHPVLPCGDSRDYDIG